MGNLGKCSLEENDEFLESWSFELLRTQFVQLCSFVQKCGLGLTSYSLLVCNFVVGNSFTVRAVSCAEMVRVG